MNDLYLGVDLGGTNLRCAVLDNTHTLLSRVAVATSAHEGPDAVINRLAKGMKQAVKEADVDTGSIKAACVGVPGPINQKAGIVHSTPNMPGWDMIPLAEILSERTGIKTFIENDANCAGWGEYTSGAGMDCNHMMMITLGTGIGGAIILDGHLHVGRDGTAGELGHVCIVDGGRQCGCGARGCVETYASATAVVRRFRDYLEEGWRSPLAGKKDFLTCADIFHAAANGDPVALKVTEETGHYLGVLAAGVAELLNPERCVISGGMIEAGELLFSSIRKTCLTRNDHPGRSMEILPARLGGNAGLVGAADQARVRLAHFNKSLL